MEIFSLIINLLLGGGFIATVVTQKQHRRKAAAEARTQELVNEEKSAEIIHIHIVEPLKKKSMPSEEKSGVLKWQYQGRRIVSILMIVLWLASCKTTQRTTQGSHEHYRGSTQYVERVDSVKIFERDSIFVKVGKDTIWLEKYVYRFRDRVKIDTVHSTDTIRLTRQEFTTIIEKPPLKDEIINAIIWLIIGIVLGIAIKIIMKEEKANTDPLKNDEVSQTKLEGIKSEEVERIPKAKQTFYKTSDGFRFISKNFAENHARNLADKTVKEIRS